MGQNRMEGKGNGVEQNGRKMKWDVIEWKEREMEGNGKWGRKEDK